MYNNTNMRGDFFAEFVYPTHTEVVDERNTIVRTGWDAILGNIFIEFDEDFRFDSIALGKDTGNGTIEIPEVPNVDIEPSEQEIIYEVRKEDIQMDITRDRVTLMAHIDGGVLTGDRSMFTSATIRGIDGRLFAYKRFGGQTTSDLIAINIRWTILIEDKCNE